MTGIGIVIHEAVIQVPLKTVHADFQSAGTQTLMCGKDWYAG